MAIAVVQNGITLGGGNNPFTATFSTLPTVGNVLIIAITTDGNLTPQSVTDNQGSQTYTRQVALAGSESGSVSFWTTVVDVSAGTFTVTITTNSSTNAVDLIEVSGANTVSVVDGVPGSMDNGTFNGKVLRCNAGAATVQNDMQFMVFTSEDTAGFTYVPPLAILDSNSTGGANTTIYVSNAPFANTGGVQGQATFNDGLADYAVVSMLVGPAGPLVSVEPVTQSVFSGSTATFSITTTASSGTVSYQWQNNGINVGTDSSTYTTGVLGQADNLSVITCIVTDSLGSNTSAGAYILVSDAVPIAWVRG